MNPQGFSFPPPPPPPPVQQHQPQQYAQNNGFAPYGQNNHGQRGGRGGGNYRGRGRGHGNRGGRGGHVQAQSGYPANTGGYGPMSYLGYPTQQFSNQQLPNQQTGIPTPNYSQSPQTYQNQTGSNSFPSHYQNSSVQASTYQNQAGYNASYTTPTSQQSPVYAQAHPTQYAAPSVQPPMMGPPMRWGFENQGHPAPFPGLQRPNQKGPRQNNTFNHQNLPGKHTNKRDHNSAFPKPQSTAPKVPAPPPVPSFGNPLPLKPPVPAESPRKPKKKKRKHNQLGLTPKTEEHESSEEEDDADEESRLAAGGAGAGTGLQVTYRGRTSKLQTSAEIAAWIAERKKRFPTQAKIEENKKAADEARKAKKAKEEAQRQQNQARKQAAAHVKKEQEKQNQKQQSREALDPADAAAKAKLKAEKLRRKLMKEEKRIAQAEADAERARKGEESQDVGTQPEPKTENQEPLAQDEAVASDPLDSSDDSDWTSSSGSDSSSDSDESDDDDAPPESATSRREGPERVPPPARDEKKRICRHFARSGRCPRGKSCKFVHEKPERDNKPKPVGNPGRKGLLEALLDRQKEDENRKLMEIIMWLGENGLLGEAGARTEATLDAANNARAQ
ncbi:hypothetical protein BDW69DRAFT_170377 [Aspergillus filifer]